MGKRPQRYSVAEDGDKWAVIDIQNGDRVVVKGIATSRAALAECKRREKEWQATGR